MIIKYVLYLLAISELGYGFQALNNLKPSTSSEIQEDTVLDLIKRHIHEKANKFSVEVKSQIGSHKCDAFQIQKLPSGVIHITATTGVVAATGFHYYLKYYCNCHISWETVNLNLPVILPDVNVTITLNDRFRYYQNVCTTSYSFVWWNWTQWENHIDWMALNSYNLVLAFNGLEAIWARIYQRMNLTIEDINEHFAGPAFLSWGRMGNIRGWGGPLSVYWHRRSLVLQQLILKRMREFGMIPVLPAFDGHLPRAFKRLYPNAKINITSIWNNFQDAYCCPYILDSTDPLFKTVGINFLKEVIAEFGTNHAYSCDTFNEMEPSSGDISYLSSMTRSVYEVMASADNNAVWIMQNWLFVHDSLFWTESRAKAVLTSVPLGNMIVLDLQAEQFPQYRRLKSYFGQPYIWCMLHNFGGTLGMFGSADIINKEIFQARNQTKNTLIGIGLTPEGINQNYVIYDLMSEMAWRKGPTNLTTWFTQYASRRYGKYVDTTDQAWQIFKNTVYNFQGLMRMRGKYAFNQRPRTKIYTWIWYNGYDFFKGWNLFLEAADSLKNSTGYLHDLVDTTRQFLQILLDEYYKEIVEAFHLKDVPNFQNTATNFLDLLRDMDCILATNQAYLLGTWLQSAKNASYTKQDEQLFEYNAKNQITLWGPNGEISDYANKQWSGIVAKYFLPRWTVFLQNINDSLINNTIFNETGTLDKIFIEVEQPFTLDRSVFPDYPIGDTVVVARDIHAKWWKVVHERFPRSESHNIKDYLSQSEETLVNYEAESKPIVYRVPYK